MLSNNNKYFFFFFLIIILIFACVIIFIYFWDNPDANYNSKKSIADCIDTSKNIQEMDIVSSARTFKIRLSRGDKTCFAPYFPYISIETDLIQNHTAWLQIIHTDNDEWRLFIDADKDLWPFYNYNKILYDSPLWTYKLWTKPLSYWEAHTYSVNISNNVIKFLGGVKWGFRLSNYRLRPIIITPSPLSIEDFKKDANLLTDQLEPKFSIQSFQANNANLAKT